MTDRGEVIYNAILPDGRKGVIRGMEEAMTDKVIEEIKGCHSIRWYDAVGEKEDVWDEHRLSLILERERLEAWMAGRNCNDSSLRNANYERWKEIRKELAQ